MRACVCDICGGLFTEEEKTQNLTTIQALTSSSSPKSRRLGRCLRPLRYFFAHRGCRSKAAAGETRGAMKPNLRRGHHGESHSAFREFASYAVGSG
mmetsp:Transcript_7300/g.14419  ORF Transcript_7300/g.14419 Transcript_7300/m.14419 type:complete len:96 (+) Transcript_7300:124-411(+)